ncbi:MAG TPA: hypothetical protein EYP17_07735 [Candidatus Latescibacteria bacterium]|nr:hypothetical protein [Candidatus Latescibacterota bacterium]
MSRPIGEIVPLRDVKLILPKVGRCKGVRALWLGCDLDHRIGPSGLEITVPEVREYKVVVVEGGL